VPSGASGQTEKKYAETLEYYLVAFFDVQGQRAKLRELRGLPRTREEFAGAAEILKGTVGSVLNLRDYFQKYFDGFMQSVESMPDEQRAKIKENVRYRGFSDSFVVSVALRNDDEQFMAMIRSRASAARTAPFRLLYSVREPAAVFYIDAEGDYAGLLLFDIHEVEQFIVEDDLNDWGLPLTFPLRRSASTTGFRASPTMP
jgi:hypothetical protein